MEAARIAEDQEGESAVLNMGLNDDDEQMDDKPPAVDGSAILGLAEPADHVPAPAAAPPRRPLLGGSGQCVVAVFLFLMRLLLAVGLDEKDVVKESKESSSDAKDSNKGCKQNGSSGDKTKPADKENKDKKKKVSAAELASQQLLSNPNFNAGNLVTGKGKRAVQQNAYLAIFRQVRVHFALCFTNRA